jgi:hypothetical protein
LELIHDARNDVHKRIDTIHLTILATFSEH